jgi:hypothetical protein
MSLGLYDIGLDGFRSADSYKSPNKQNNQRTSAVVWSWVPGDAKTGGGESGRRGKSGLRREGGCKREGGGLRRTSA